MTPFDPRPSLLRSNLSQTAAGRLLGVPARTMRGWCAKPGTDAYRPMPGPAVRLLLLIADYPGVVPFLERLRDG